MTGLWKEAALPQFMDFHPDLKLPADVVNAVTQGARAGTKDEFGVRQIELYHNPDGQVYCLLEAPDADAVRKHHEAAGLTCGDIHQVDGIT